MNPAKVVREHTRKLTDLPNIGKALEANLKLLGIEQPENLVGLDPYEMYERLCAMTGTQQDPCVLDVFISVTRFMAGEAPKPWWAYTAERKNSLAGK